MHPRSRTRLAWLVFGATFACLAGGLVVTPFVTWPLTADVLVNGASDGAIWLLFATIGLVLTLRRPANPIGWLYAAAGRPPGRPVRGQPVGGRPHPGRHPAAAAAAERAATLAALAGGADRQRGRDDRRGGRLGAVA
jgi:hypothetical protein